MFSFCHHLVTLSRDQQTHELHNLSSHGNLVSLFRIVTPNGSPSWIIIFCYMNIQPVQKICFCRLISQWSLVRIFVYNNLTWTSTKSLVLVLALHHHKFEGTTIYFQMATLWDDNEERVLFKHMCVLDWHCTKKTADRQLNSAHLVHVVIEYV